jgi:hypothetical protein
MEDSAWREAQRLKQTIKCFDLAEGYADYFGDFCFVLKQPFIAGERPSAKEIVGEMEKREFEDMGGGQLFTNDAYIIDDLHEGNVIKSADGLFYFIDTFVLYTKNSE